METILFNYRVEHYPERQSQEDAYIAGLDPLGVDGKIRHLPGLNKSRDLDAMVALLYSILPSPVQLQNFDYYEAVATMRDIGMFLGSIKRLGKEPVHLVPELEYVLEELAAKTNMPPRDTLLHYSVWNPDGIRQRSYTGTSDEFHLIKSVKVAMHPLLRCINQLSQLQDMDPATAAFAEKAEEVSSWFKGMIAGVVLAKREVDPRVFATELRFYFDPISIFGKEYLGPGAVEMPMFLYDQMLWVGAEARPSYREFQETYVPYILPHLRTLYAQTRDRDSLVEIINARLCEPGIFNPQLMRSAKALQRLLKQLMTFRMPHKKMAESSYKHEQAQHSKGSGGYSTTILHEIMDLSMEKIKPFEVSLQQYLKRGSI